MPVRLDYRGDGCGGVNLRCDTIKTAIAYAEDRGATSLTILAETSPVVLVRLSRPDCRFNWRNDA